MVELHGPGEIIVLLGSPTPESTEIFARTVTEGDPTWVGPLAGIPLKLPVYHILEPEVKEQIAPQVYEEQVSIMESVLEVDDLIQAVRRVRDSLGSS